MADAAPPPPTFATTVAQLTADQQEIIKEELARKERVVKAEMQTEAEKTMRKAKEEFKSAVQSVRKPETYTSEKDIKVFLTSFELYTKSINLNADKVLPSFITYLDAESFQKLKVLDILEIKNWKEFKEATIEALSPAISKMAIKQKLRNSKQKPNETVTEFYNRIVILVSQHLDDVTSDAERSALLKETLASGLSDDEISVEIIEQDKWTFKESLDYAIRREQSKLARREILGEDKEHLTILNVREPLSNPPERSAERPEQILNASQVVKGYERPEIRCHNCNNMGHLFKDCPIPQTCFHCRKPGHVRRDCYALQSEMKNQKQAVQRNNNGSTGWSSRNNFSQNNIRQSFRNQTPSNRGLVFNNNRGQSFNRGQNFGNNRGRNFNGNRGQYIGRNYDSVGPSRTREGVNGGTWGAVNQPVPKGGDTDRPSLAEQEAAFLNRKRGFNGTSEVANDAQVPKNVVSPLRME